MSKYKDVKDYIKQEFMKDLDDKLFDLIEDEIHYHIIYIKNNGKIISFYKDKIAEQMEKMEQINSKFQDK